MLTTEKQILALGTELHARRGELLYRKQQPAEYVFYLLNGAVGIRGDDSHTRHLAGCRCFLGLWETLLHQPHEATVQVTDHALLLVFDRQRIEEAMEQHPPVRRYFMQQICEQMATREYE